MMLADQSYVSADYIGLHADQLWDALDRGLMRYQEFDAFVISDVAAHAGLGVSGLACDSDLIQTGFVQGDDLILMGGSHALVKVVAFGQERLGGGLSSLG
jgi:hypothetical protein